MGVIDTLVRQSGNPTGFVGRVMIKIMNKVDSGLNQWVIETIKGPIERALEIGCGGGETLHLLQKNSQITQIIGIDYSIEAVRLANKKNMKAIENESMEILQANVTALPFSQYHFDCVLAVRSHYFWDDLEKGFAEIYRTLKQGGVMLIFSETYKIQYHMKRYQTDDSMTMLLYSIGFKNIKIENRKTVQCISAYK